MAGKTIKLGNSWFLVDAFKDLSYDDWVIFNKGKLTGIDIGRAYKALTGRPAIKSKNGKLNDLQKRLQAFDPDETLNDVLSIAAVEQFIAEEVRKRLNDKGEDATGKKIKTYGATGSNVYAFRTIQEKQIAGLPFTRVTLRDTGSFQKSFELKLQKELFNIEGDSDKSDGQIEDNVDLTNVLNLSQTEKNNVVNEIRPTYIQKVRQAVKL